MPLLTSPIDGSPMKQIHRYGIEIDVCPTSGGIWLDKHELEKLMVIIQEDSSHDYAPRPTDISKHQTSGRLYRDHDDDDDDKYYKRHSGHENHQKYGPYKKSKMSRIMDIFDF